jgi:hypothetical protein
MFALKYPSISHLEKIAVQTIGEVLVSAIPATFGGQALHPIARLLF